ncbi:NAC domain-containing protein 18-like [Punica granatum]|uniref:NAC domain-containing protein 18-like n=1 Tax=Punica granatum TaxID=22663 RepID=A0A218Y083_PUNGR|nr:NAC domain-containing protein 18-like [Punica granatum]OWM90614.1 hypothetical protein CDL15_Pgr014917 [Punica granatum]
MISSDDDGGVTRGLPPGFRFEPTNEEFVVEYLKRKIFSLPLPASVISDHINPYDTDPRNLLPPPAASGGDVDQGRHFFFFFSKVEDQRKGKKLRRYYWKTCGTDVDEEQYILSPKSENNALMGVKRILIASHGAGGENCNNEQASPSPSSSWAVGVGHARISPHPYPTYCCCWLLIQLINS